MPTIFYVEPEETKNFYTGEWVPYNEEPDSALVEMQADPDHVETKSDTSWLSDQLVSFSHFIRLKITT